MAHVTATWLGLLPALCSASDASFDIHFQCRYSSATNWNECRDPKVNGYCGQNEECLARYNEQEQHMYAACCCNTTTTLVDRINHDRFANGSHKWSSMITNGGGPGGPGYCDIKACFRPETAQQCPRRIKPRCCPANTVCGLDLSTQGSCCGPIPPVSPDCCTNGTGQSCAWWSPWFWLWFPLPGFHSCCLELEESCKESCRTSQVLLGLSVSTILVVYLLLHKSKSWFGNSRRAATRVRIVLVFAGLQFLLALANEESWLEAAAWVLRSSMALLLCLGLATCCCPTQNRPHLQSTRSTTTTTTTTSGCSRPTQYIVVLLVIENYLSRAWAPVEDKSMDSLESVLRTMGYTVVRWQNPAHGEFEGIMSFICSSIAGTTDSKVIIYASCHARTIYGSRFIIPSDAEAGLFAWHQWISVDNFLRDLNTNEATDPHFIMLVNGCGTRLDRCDQMWWRLWRLWHGGEDEDEVILESDEVNVNIFYACGPGGSAFVDNMTIAFGKSLDDPTRDLNEIFRIMRTELREGNGARNRTRQRLWRTTSDRPISLQVPRGDMSFQSATRSSSSLA